ncbi:MAG: hypothetical protein K9L96_05315, partial [Candidatus Omnitrophica bacterium]|nr:hypothetical protein [Candidatus Omnitrophota bacterium]
MLKRRLNQLSCCKLEIASEIKRFTAKGHLGYYFTSILWDSFEELGQRHAFVSRKIIQVRTKVNGFKIKAHRMQKIIKKASSLSTPKSSSPVSSKYNNQSSSSLISIRNSGDTILNSTDLSFSSSPVGEEKAAVSFFNEVDSSSTQGSSGIIKGKKGKAVSLRNLILSSTLALAFCGGCGGQGVGLITRGADQRITATQGITVPAAKSEVTESEEQVLPERFLTEEEIQLNGRRETWLSLANENYTTVFERAGEFLNEPFAFEVLRAAVLASPSGPFYTSSVSAIDHFDRYASHPQSLEIAQKAVDNGAGYKVYNNIGRIIRSSKGKDIVKYALSFDPKLALQNLDPDGTQNFIQSAEGEFDFIKFLKSLDDPVAKAVLSIWNSTYDKETKEKITGLTHKIVEGSLSIEGAAEIARDDLKFLRELIRIRSEAAYIGRHTVTTNIIISTFEIVKRANDSCLEGKALSDFSPEELFYILRYGFSNQPEDSFEDFYKAFKDKLVESPEPLKEFTRFLSYGRDFRRLFGLFAQEDKLQDFLTLFNDVAIKDFLINFVKGKDLDSFYANPGVGLRYPAVQLILAEYLLDHSSSLSEDEKGKVLGYVRQAKEDIANYEIENPGFRRNNFMQNAQNFQSQPFIQQIIRQVVEETAEANPGYFDFFHNSEKFINTEYGLPAFQRAAYQNPTGALHAIFNSEMVKQKLQSLDDPVIQKILDLEAYELPKHVVTDRLLDRKDEMALLMDDFVNSRLSFEEGFELSANPFRLKDRLRQLSAREEVIGRFAIDEYLTEFYLRAIRYMNELHNEPDNVRFADLEEVSATGLYNIIVYGEQEIYTSTFNGVFNRLLETMARDELAGGQLLRDVDYLRFRSFVRLLISFGRLNEFLATMDKTSSNNLLERFVKGLEKERTFLIQAAVVAEGFSMIEEEMLLRSLQKFVKEEFDRVQAENHREGTVIYGILSGMFGEKAVINGKWFKAMSERFGVLRVNHVASQKLFNQHGVNIQHFFFYDDEDGRQSFEHFLAPRRNDPNWKITYEDSYVHLITTGPGKRIEIFANKPDKESEGPKDISAVLDGKNEFAHVVVHRGHSYHAKRTINQIESTAVIVSLGSCGGFSLIHDVLDHSPEAHILSTKGTGSMYVNDPLLRMLNRYILSGQNISWNDFWADAERRIISDYFNQYIAPHRNIGALFLKAYNKMISESESEIDSRDDSMLTEPRFDVLGENGLEKVSVPIFHVSSPLKNVPVYIYLTGWFFCNRKTKEWINFLVQLFDFAGYPIKGCHSDHITKDDYKEVAQFLDDYVYRRQEKEINLVIAGAYYRLCILDVFKHALTWADKESKFLKVVLFEPAVQIKKRKGALVKNDRLIKPYWALPLFNHHLKNKSKERKFNYCIFTNEYRYTGKILYPESRTHTLQFIHSVTYIDIIWQKLEQFPKDGMKFGSSPVETKYTSLTLKSVPQVKLTTLCLAAVVSSSPLLTEHDNPGYEVTEINRYGHANLFVDDSYKSEEKYRTFIYLADKFLQNSASPLKADRGEFEAFTIFLNEYMKKIDHILNYLDMAVMSVNGRFFRIQRVIKGFLNRLGNDQLDLEQIVEQTEIILEEVEREIKIWRSIQPNLVKNYILCIQAIADFNRIKAITRKRIYLPETKPRPARKTIPKISTEYIPSARDPQYWKKRWKELNEEIAETGNIIARLKSEKKFTHPELWQERLVSLEKKKEEAKANFIEHSRPKTGFSTGAGNHSSSVLGDGTEVKRISRQNELPPEAGKYWNGHEALYILENDRIGYRAYVCVHAYVEGSSIRYPAIGGTRNWPYEREEDAVIDVLKLSEAMSYKNALAGIPLGGAKIVFPAFSSKFLNSGKKADDSGIRKKALKSLALALEESKVMLTGQDVGISSEDALFMAKYAPSVLCGTGNIALGGKPTTPNTAEGVYQGIKAAVDFVYGSKPVLNGIGVILQGVGGVGAMLLNYLLKDGAYVYLSDINTSCLEGIKNSQIYSEYLNKKLFFVEPDEVYSLKADIFSPCALGGILNKNTIPLLKNAGVKIAAGAANNQLDKPSDGELLFKNNTIYVPDYVINSGGVLAAASKAVGYNLPLKIKEIAGTVREILEISSRENRPEAEVADVLAREKVAKTRINANSGSLASSSVEVLNKLRNMGIAVDLSKNTINGIGIKQFCKSRGLFYDSPPFTAPEAQKYYDEYLHVARTRWPLADVERYITGYAERLGSEENTQRWIDGLKRAARRNRTKQKDYLSGKSGPHRGKKDSPLEWAMKGVYFPHVQQRRLGLLFASIDITGLNLADLPIWPVDEQSNIRYELIEWMARKNKSPPLAYYQKRKISLREITPALCAPPSQLPLFSSSNLSVSLRLKLYPEIIDDIYALEKKAIPNVWRWERLLFNKIASDRESLFFILKAGADLAGYAVFNLPLGLLSRIAVYSKKRGYGSLLLQVVVEQLVTAGIRELRIMPVNNSRGFYEKFAEKETKVSRIDSEGLGIIKYSLDPKTEELPGASSAPVTDSAQIARAAKKILNYLLSGKRIVAYTDAVFFIYDENNRPVPSAVVLEFAREKISEHFGIIPPVDIRGSLSETENEI